MYATKKKQKINMSLPVYGLPAKKAKIHCAFFRIFTNSIFIAVQVELAAQDPGKIFDPPIRCSPREFQIVGW